MVLLACNFVSAQKPITIGTQHKMTSKALGEDREYWVHLPDSYLKEDIGKAKYPVIYLLDGETNFHSLVGIQKNLTRGMYNYMPECIIVGVVNVDRNRDFTPSQSSVERNGVQTMTTSGGARPFLNFMVHELRQEIDSKYRTSGYNVLIGHSLGGLFAINTLLHHPSSFNAYISLDPSLWWDDEKVFNEAEQLWLQKDFANKFLFVGMAKTVKRPHDKREHSSVINEFCTSLMSQFPGNKLISDWRYYEFETHGTVTTIGMLDGLRILFQGIELPVKQIPKEMSVLTKAFDELSAKLGHQFIPSEDLVDKLAKFAVTSGEEQGALDLLEYNLRNYPDSPRAKQHLTEFRSQKE